MCHLHAASAFPRTSPYCTRSAPTAKPVFGARPERSGSGSPRGVYIGAVNESTLFEDARLGSIIQALQLLAAEPDEQIEALSAFARIAREMEAGEPVQRVDRELADEGVLPPASFATLERVDTCFEQILQSGDPEIWTERGIRTHPLWQRVRELARQSLEELGMPRRPPPLPV